MDRQLVVGLDVEVAPRTDLIVDHHAGMLQRVEHAVSFRVASERTLFGQERCRTRRLAVKNDASFAATHDGYATRVLGAYLPGRCEVELRDVPDPTPGAGQVLVAMRASTICGSDLRAIYREHLGEGAEAYQGVIAGHEPAGEIVAVGPECRRFRVGDRVALYHIAGCGVCHDCRMGYMISCTSPMRAAYGWQRDGGHADVILADESTCVLLPESLSFIDGACVACSFGTAYEALCRAAVSGRDAVLVTGLGPVGLALGLLAHAMGARSVLGADPDEERRQRAVDLGAVDESVDAGSDA